MLMKPSKQARIESVAAEGHVHILDVVYYASGVRVVTDDTNPFTLRKLPTDLHLRLVVVALRHSIGEQPTCRAYVTPANAADFGLVSSWHGYCSLVFL